MTSAATRNPAKRPPKSKLTKRAMLTTTLFVMVGFSLLVGDADGLLDRLGLLEHTKHEMGDVGA